MTEPVRSLDTPEKLGLRVEDFVLLEESGAFAEYGMAELIDGEIYVMIAQFARHAIAKVNLLVELAIWLKANRRDLRIFSEVSIRTAVDSMPQPDILVGLQQGVGPVPVENIVLAVEVADTTLRTDLGRKAELYAGAGIPEYWVVDLNGGRVLQHDQPGAADYGRRNEVSFGETLVAATLDGFEIDTARLLD